MRWLKQSTSWDGPIGPFLDDTDGKTAETALTITQPDIRLKKNGGAWAQKAAAQTLSHEENGFYEVTLDATDTATLGLLRLAVFEAGALPVWEDFIVLPPNVYDSFVAGSDLLDISLVQVNGAAQTATLDTIKAETASIQSDTNDIQTRLPAALVSGRIDASVGAMAANVMTAAASAADFMAEVNAEVVDALNTDTYAEPGQGTPGATISLAQKIGYLFKAWRNKHTQTATEYALYADDTTTKDQEAVVSDDGATFSRGEVSTGA